MATKATLLTCSNYDVRAFRLFDTFRQYHPEDKIIWLIADRNYLNPVIGSAIEAYYGNMEVRSSEVNADFWNYRQRFCQPRWWLYEEIMNEFSDDEVILHCDTNDLMFQNPLNFGDRIKNNTILCGYEGMQYKDNPCCLNWFEPENQVKYMFEEVKCAGCLAMNGKTFKRLVPLIGHIEKTYSDQNLLQVVADEYNFSLIDDPKIESVSEANGWTFDNDKLVNKYGLQPSILHFCGANANQRIMGLLLSLHSIDKCIDTQNKIFQTIS